MPGERACELCGALVPVDSGFRAAGPRRLIDRKEFVCAVCHAQWQTMLESLLDVACEGGSEFVLIAIAAGKSMAEMRRAIVMRTLGAAAVAADNEGSTVLEGAVPAAIPYDADTARMRPTS